jgi:hypothetical protein
MAQTSVASNVTQTINRLGALATQGALDIEIVLKIRRDRTQFFVGELFGSAIGI